VLNLTSSTVSVLLGTGTGSFGAKTDFPTGANPRMMAMGDLSGDGKMDLAVANYNSGTVSVLLGTGTGSFGAKTDYATGVHPFSAAIGDLNGDGKADLAVANEGRAWPQADSSTVSVLLGTGGGAFGARTDRSTGAYSNPQSVAIGDLNGDGTADLAVANVTSRTVSVFLGTGGGAFGARTDYPTGDNPRLYAIVDLNGDGNADLTVANIASDSVSVLLGTGTGSFGARTDFATGARPNSASVGDLDGNAAPDLAVANFGSNTVSVFRGLPLPPTVTCTTSVSALQPWGGGLVNVGLTVTSSDPAATKTIAVYSNDPNLTGTSTSFFYNGAFYYPKPAAAQVFGSNLLLRADRYASPGRIYLIVAKATNADGTGFASTTVVVPYAPFFGTPPAALITAAANAKAYCDANGGAPPPGLVPPAGTGYSTHLAPTTLP